MSANGLWNPGRVRQVTLSNGERIDLPLSYRNAHTWSRWDGHLEEFIPREVVYFHEWEGLTFQEIAELFTKLGVPARNGGRWGYQSAHGLYRMQVERREAETLELHPDPVTEDEIEAFARMFAKEFGERKDGFEWTSEELEEATDLAVTILDDGEDSAENGALFCQYCGREYFLRPKDSEDPWSDERYCGLSCRVGGNKARREGRQTPAEKASEERGLRGVDMAAEIAALEGWLISRRKRLALKAWRGMPAQAL